MQKQLATLSVALGLSLLAGQARADERQDLEVMRQTTINLINALVDKGVLTNDAAKALITQAEDNARKKIESERGGPDSKVVRVPYVPESVKREIREQVKQEVVAQAKAERWGDINAIPEWLDRLKWEGDIRARYESQFFAKTNPLPAVFAAARQNLNNTTEPYNRERIRARLGLLAKVTPGVSAGFRLTTGNSSDPVSTNQTLGNYENKYSLVIDRAYLKLDPWQSVTISGGRIPNPYFSTDLVWDSDLNFEGVAVSLRTPESSAAKIRPFATVGAFALQDLQKSDTQSVGTKWLWGAQAGVEWRTNTGNRAKFGAAYYAYQNIHGIPNPIGTIAGAGAYDASAPQFRQKGNTVFDINRNATTANGGIPPELLGLAADYRLLNLTGTLDLANFEPVHVIVTGDYVRNIGYNQSEIIARTGLARADTAPKVTGWQARLTVGYPEIHDLYDWQIFGGYRYLQRDAVLDAFTDSDFHLGGTDTKGYFIGGSLGINKNTWLSLRWLSADQIDGLPLSIDVLHVDLNAKF